MLCTAFQLLQGSANIQNRWRGELRHHSVDYFRRNISAKKDYNPVAPPGGKGEASLPVGGRPKIM